MRLPASGEYSYSQSQLSAFAEAQQRFDDAMYRQYGVLHGFDATPARRKTKIAAALHKPLAIAGWGTWVVYLIVAVPLLIIFILASFGAMIVGW